MNGGAPGKAPGGAVGGPRQQRGRRDRQGNQQGQQQQPPQQQPMSQPPQQTQQQQQSPQQPKVEAAQVPEVPARGSTPTADATGLPTTSSSPKPALKMGKWDSGAGELVFGLLAGHRPRRTACRFPPLSPPACRFPPLSARRRRNSSPSPHPPPPRSSPCRWRRERLQLRVFSGRRRAPVRYGRIEHLGREQYQRIEQRLGGASAGGGRRVGGEGQRSGGEIVGRRSGVLCVSGGGGRVSQGDRRRRG